MSRHLELEGVAVFMLPIHKEVWMGNWIWIRNIMIPKKDISVSFRFLV